MVVLCRDTRPVSSCPDFLVPFPWFPDRDWVQREWKGWKSLNLCLIWLKVPPNVKNWNWNLNIGSFCCIIQALFHYFELWIKFCVVSNPVSTGLGFSNRVSICPVPPKTCLDTTLIHGDVILNFCPTGVFVRIHNNYILYCVILLLSCTWWEWAIAFEKVNRRFFHPTTTKGWCEELTET